MTVRFADTSFYVALFNPRDEAHAEARRYATQADLSVVTTAWVLTELANYLADTPNRGLFASFVRDLRRKPQVTIVPPDNDLFDEGIRLYDEREDKTWSLTDCMSILVMQRYGLRDALTTDHHFEQAGFGALLKAGIEK